ncbi:MAG: c-type cytochrome [Anaerolineae bacterium]
MEKRAIAVLALVSGAFLVACGGAPPPTPTSAPVGDPAKGREVYEAQACAACHMINGQGGTVGPDLSHVGTEGATRKPGVPAADYIRESILDPDAFVVEGFSAGLMPRNFGDRLSERELNDLIAYLLSLQGR